MAPVVVGAGVAGLVAAYELVKKGQRPIVLEPAAAGGMIRSEVRDGFTLEKGPNVLVERPEMSRLLRELGLQAAIRYPSVPAYGQYVWAQERVMKVPAGLKELLTSKLFSLGTTVALPVKLFVPGLLKPTSDDLSVLDFFTPIIGQRTAYDMLDPVLKGIYGGDVAKLSARTLFPGLWAAAVRGASLLGYLKTRPKGGKPKVMVVAGGVERIVSALVDKLSDAADFRTCAAVAIAKKAASSYVVTCSDGSHIETDTCVVTVAGEPLRSLVAPLDSALADRLRGMRYASLTVVHASVPRTERLVPDAFGILFPAGMPLNLLGVMFNSLIFPHVAPPDRHVITIILGGDQAGEVRIEEGQAKRELPQLLESLIGVRGFEWMAQTEWSKAIPQLVVGHHEVVAACDAFEKSNPGIVLTGVQRGGVGVSDRIRHACEAVERVSSQAIKHAA